MLNLLITIAGEEDEAWKIHDEKRLVSVGIVLMNRILQFAAFSN